MSDKYCKDCKYFLQHYTFNKRELFRIHCGHCTLNRARSKKPDTVACKNFTSGMPQEDAFVSKEYLSKQLLQYMLQLDLLPEIYNAEPDVALTFSK